MTPLLLGGAVGAAGAAGAVCRAAAERAATRRGSKAWGTAAVNVSGSLLLGLLAGLLGAGTAGRAEALTILGTGFCGGFTTFSGWVVDATTVGWWRRAGGGLVVVPLLLGLLAAALGLTAGRALGLG